MLARNLSGRDRLRIDSVSSAVVSVSTGLLVVGLALVVRLRSSSVVLVLVFPSSVRSSR